MLPCLRSITALATLCLAACASLAQPSNNGCGNAIFIGPGSPAFDGNNTGATNDGPTSCVSLFGADVWFFWVAPPTPVPVVIDTCGSSFDTTLAVYTGRECPPNASAQVACDDDGATCGAQPFRQSRVAFTTVAGQAYLIRVGGFNNAQGNIVLNLCIPPVVTGTSGGGILCGQQFRTLTCSATGVGLSFQWFQHNQLITDATTASIDIPMSSGDTYFCRVTNACGFADSPRW